MVARHTELEYLAAAFAGDRLDKGTWIVANDGRISMVRRYQIVRPADGATLLRGSTRWVCVALDRRNTAAAVESIQELQDEEGETCEM